MMWKGDNSGHNTSPPPKETEPSSDFNAVESKDKGVREKLMGG
jgi:hypothetical protein